MWKFKKEKNPNANKKQQPSVYSNYITVVGSKWYRLKDIKAIKNNNSSIVYVAKAYVTDKSDDAIYFDFPSPIAFELPENNPKLIPELVKAYDKTKSERGLNEEFYTYIGNIKRGQDGNLYYYNEPPSKEVADAIGIEEETFRKQYHARIKEIQEAQRRNAEASKEAEFRRRLEIDKNIKENQEYDLKKRNERLRNSYFKQENRFGKEGYDAINLNDGSIMIIRDMQKFKDNNGRYLYTAYIRTVNEDAYTEYNYPLGNQIVFTTPRRLSDIISDQKNNQAVVQSVQKMLSDACTFIDYKGADGLLDIGGVLADGRIVQNSERNGISSSIVNKIKSLGAKSMEEMDRSR